MTSLVPVTRSLAAVLRDEFSTDDDAIRLVIGSAGPQFVDGTTDSYAYVNVVINGQTLKVPRLSSAQRRPTPGSTLYLLATRTILLYVGQVIDTA